MEVILLERIGKLGQMGDVVRVKDGYARNFLLPRGKALRATADNKSKFEGMKAELQTQAISKPRATPASSPPRSTARPIVVIRQAQRNRPVVRLGVDRATSPPAQGRRRRGQPLACRAQRADQDDRPVQGAAGAASGRRGRRSPSPSRAAQAEAERIARGEDVTVRREDAEEEAAAALGDRRSLLRAGSGQGADAKATKRRRKPRPTRQPTRRGQAGQEAKKQKERRRRERATVRT